MVKTYAFNPSTQCTLDVFGGAPQSVHGGVMAKRTEVDTPPLRRQQAMSDGVPQYSSTTSGELRHQDSYSNASSVSNSASDKGYYSPSRAAEGRSGRAVEVIEENTPRVFAIRTVLIHGQRFYQPFECGTVDDQTAKASLKKSLSMGKSTQNAIFTTLRAVSTNDISFKPAQTKENEPSVVKSCMRGEAPDRNQEQPTRQMMDGGSGLPPWAAGNNPQPRSGKRGTAEWRHAAAVNGQSANFTPHDPFLSLSNSFVSSSYSFPSPTFTADPMTRNMSSASHPQRVVNNFADTPEERAKRAREQYQRDLVRQVEECNRRKMMEKQKEWEQDERERMRNEIYQRRIRTEMEEEERKAREKTESVKRKAERIAAAQKATSEQLEQEKRINHRAVSAVRNTNEVEENKKNGGPDDGLEWWEKKDMRKVRAKSPARDDLEAFSRAGSNGWDNHETNLRHRKLIVSDERDPSPRRSASRRSRGSSGELRAGDPHNRAIARAFDSGERPPSRPIRPANRSRSSRLSYKSSMEEKDEPPASRLGSSKSMRNLPRTQAAMEREQQRVRRAIDSREYGNHVFDDHYGH